MKGQTWLNKQQKEATKSFVELLLVWMRCLKTLFKYDPAVCVIVSSLSSGHHGDLRHAAHTERDLQLVHTHLRLLQTKRSHVEGAKHSDYNPPDPALCQTLINAHL